MLVLASISESLVNIAWHFVRDAGLPAVFVLMVAESACIPIPSEATMLFAGFAVADPGQSSAHHHLTLLGIVVAGVLGNLVGSWIAYGVGRAGRLELVERHGHWLHMKPSHIAWADRWFARYGAPAILLQPHAADHPHVHLAARGCRAHAVRALHGADAARMHPVGAGPRAGR